MYSNVSSFLSQGLRDNTSLAFKDDSVLYGKFVSDIEVLGDFARDRVSARYISLPGLYLISASYCGKRRRSLCRRFGADANGLLEMDTKGL